MLGCGRGAARERPTTALPDNYQSKLGASHPTSSHVFRLSYERLAARVVRYGRTYSVPR